MPDSNRTATGNNTNPDRPVAVTRLGPPRTNSTVGLSMLRYVLTKPAFGCSVSPYRAIVWLSISGWNAIQIGASITGAANASADITIGRMPQLARIITIHDTRRNSGIIAHEAM